MPDPLPFGPSLWFLVETFSTFGLFKLTTFISGSRLLTLPPHPCSRPPSLVLAVATAPRGLVTSP